MLETNLGDMALQPDGALQTMKQRELRNDAF